MLVLLWLTFKETLELRRFQKVPYINFGFVMIDVKLDLIQNFQQSCVKDHVDWEIFEADHRINIWPLMALNLCVKLKTSLAF